MKSLDLGITVSIKEFLASSWKLFLVIFLCLLGDVTGNIFMAFNIQHFPAWLLLLISNTGLVFACFWSFHKARIVRDTLFDERRNRVTLAREAIKFAIEKIERYKDEDCNYIVIKNEIDAQGKVMASILGAGAEADFLRSRTEKYKDDLLPTRVGSADPDERKYARYSIIDAHIAWLRHQSKTITIDKIEKLWLIHLVK